MAHYQTEQKRVLLSYMKAHSDQAYTVEELCQEMEKELPEGGVPGKSTVYRLMPGLVEEGLVKRFTKENSRKFLYQMVCGEHCGSHLHMKCSVCGKLYHMEDGESEKLLLEVMKKHHFRIDGGRTMLFGRCEGCGVEDTP